MDIRLSAENIDFIKAMCFVIFFGQNQMPVYKILTNPVYCAEPYFAGKRYSCFGSMKVKLTKLFICFNKVPEQIHSFFCFAR